MAFYSKLAQFYTPVFPFREPVYRFLKNRLPAEGDSILDAGCGPGQYAARFAGEGYSALGIDLDVEMIRLARRLAGDCPFRVLDLRDIDTLERSFDLIFCIGNTMAHLPGRDFKQCVEAVYARLNPGGIWVIQMRNWDHVLKLESYDFPVINAGSGIRFYRHYADITEARLFFDTRLIVDGRTLFEERVPLYPIKSDHCAEMHERAGFHLQEHFADFAGTRYSETEDTSNVLVYQK